jgi:hypothetical protein
MRDEPLLPPIERYRPFGWRRRLGIVLLAMATTVAVMLILLDPPGGVQRVKRAPPDAPACTVGAGTGCVGGRVDVIVVPRGVAASEAERSP